MAIRHLVLGALHHGPASGYRIAARLARRAAAIGRIEPSRVYEALGELARAGAIEPLPPRPGGKGSERRYQIAERGRRELERWLDAPVPAAEWLRRPLLARLVIAGTAGGLAVRDLATEVIARRRRLAEAAAGAGAGRVAGARAGGGESVGDALERRFRERARMRLEIEIATLEALAVRLRAGADAPAVSSPRTPPPPASASR